MVEARGVLAAIPRSGWTQDMDALDQRLARDEVLARRGRVTRPGMMRGPNACFSRCSRMKRQA